MLNHRDNNLSCPSRPLVPSNLMGLGNNNEVAQVVPKDFWEAHHRDNINPIQPTKEMLQRAQLTDLELQKIVSRFPYGQIVIGDGNCFLRCCMSLQIRLSIRGNFSLMIMIIQRTQ